MNHNTKILQVSDAKVSKRRRKRFAISTGLLIAAAVAGVSAAVGTGISLHKAIHFYHIKLLTFLLLSEKLLGFRLNFTFYWILTFPHL